MPAAARTPPAGPGERSSGEKATGPERALDLEAGDPGLRPGSAALQPGQVINHLSLAFLISKMEAILVSIIEDCWD